VVRSPKGFGRNYFTLAAIQAYSSSACAHAVYTAVRTHARRDGLRADDDRDAPPEDEVADLLLEEQQPEPSRRPCHCNCFFRRRTRAVRRRVRFNRRPLCRCRKTKSGIAPPFPRFFSHQQNN
jgi:hypothetical protein